METITIKGHAHDITNDEDLIGAHVIVSDASGQALYVETTPTNMIGTATDENGDFRLNNVPADASHLTLQYQGKIFTKEITEGDNDFNVKIADNVIPGVTITGNGPQPQPRKRPAWVLPAAIGGGAVLLLLIMWLLMNRKPAPARRAV